MLGTTVGAYRITGIIGQGGMGAVYAAEHSLLGRPAAVKVLLPELSHNQEIVTRFFNEAKASTAIRHPGIVEIYDFGWNQDGSAYIAMEFLQGESLASRLGRGRVGAANALAIARQIAGALSAAHRKGIVHRDLKPDNAYLVPDPEVPSGERIKLLDFGIAKLAGDQSMSQKTRTGSLMGTPTYMAPEQCRGVAVDARADLYSLGCIIFEMVTGRPPFIGEGVGDVLAAHIHVAPVALSTLASDVTPATEQIVQRLLAKDPAHRFQTADEVIHAIDATGASSYRSAPRLGTVPNQAIHTPSQPTTLSGSAVSATTPPTPSSRRTMFGVAAGAVVVIAIIAVVAVSRGSETPPSEANVAATNAAPAQAATAPTLSPTQAPTTADPVPASTAAPAPTAAPSPPPTSAPPPAVTIAVSITSIPAGAQVVLAGKVLGVTPFTGSLPHTGENQRVILRLAGYKDAPRTVSMDSDIKLSVKLDKKHVAASPGTTDRDRGVNPFGN